MENEEESRQRKIKTGTGLGLVGLGVLGVVWIAWLLFSLGDGPHAIPLVGKFLAFDAAARTIVTPSGNYEVPEGAYFAAGIFLYIMVLAVAVSLIKALLTAGVTLLGHDVASAVNRLGEEFARFKAYLETRDK
jgi:hypothetical protein